MLKYSFIVPIYNDGELVDEFCIEFNKVFQKFLSTDEIASFVELILIDDGSNNNSFAFLEDASKKFTFIKVISLSRNFGHHIAVSCGYELSSGEYVGMLNVDMQDPPNQIPLLLNKIESEQLDIVWGVRIFNVANSSTRASSYIFHLILNKISGLSMPFHTATLRVMSRRFVTAYNMFSERVRFLPGLENWLGFKQGFVDINYQLRQKGKSSYTMKKKFILAFNSIIGFSNVPIVSGVIIGFGIACTGFLLMIIFILAKIFYKNILPGYVSLMSVILFLGGLQMVLLGIIGIYIGRILRETQQRPLYIIKDRIRI